MCFLLWHSCIAYWEHRKYECFRLFFLFLLARVSGITGHTVRIIVQGNTPGWAQAATSGLDVTHPGQELWEQTHCSWQRNQPVTFVPAIASCVLLREDIRWVRNCNPCGVPVHTFHCGSQHMCCGNCLFRNHMWAEAGGGPVFSDKVPYPTAKMPGIFS